jgi:excisionase family DNA binding protein
LSVSEAQIRRLEQRGELPAVRFGKTVRFRREDLDRFIEDHLVGSEGA